MGSDSNESPPGDHEDMIVDGINRNVKNTDESMEEEIPPILSATGRTVFPLFADMLDIKSYMRLAMTNKEMYDRCLNDKRVRINVDVEEVYVMLVHGVQNFSLYPTDVSYKNIEKYCEKLCQLNCNISLKRIHFTGQEIGVGTIIKTLRYLDEIGVRKIDSLEIPGELTGWSLIAFIKDFHIKNVDIGSGLTEDVLRSLLQLNLNSFSYGDQVEGDILLQVESFIPNLQLTGLRPSADEFTQILWKIQTGALKKLVMMDSLIPWDSYTRVEDDHDGPLPDARPLLMSAEFSEFFLHWDGGVTECSPGFACVSISKCKPDNVPFLFQSKEYVHKALAQCGSQIPCPKDHFLSFFDEITVLDFFHEGPLPGERPLLCIDHDFEERYHVLNEDDTINIYAFDEDLAEFRGNYDMVKSWPDIYSHTPLQKFVFDKRIEKRVNGGEFPCRGFDEFDFLFEDYEPLPHDFRGQLPERRPLVFKKTLHSEQHVAIGDAAIEEEYRFVLYDDGTLIQYRCDTGYHVTIEPCPPWNLLSIMLSFEKLKEIIFKGNLVESPYRVDHDMFRKVFKGIKTLQFHTYGDLPAERPLVFKKTQVKDGEIIDERWFVPEFGEVRHCLWMSGRLVILRGDPAHFPFILTKDLVTRVFQGKQVVTKCGFYIDREILNHILDGFDVHAYEDSVLPFDDRPLIFKKTEIRHTCREDSNDDCDCIEESLRLCLVNCKGEVREITWGVEEDRFLSFDDCPQPDDVPLALKTIKMLEYLLKLPVNPDEERVHWYGSFEDACDYFDGHRTVAYYYNGPLPETRPLVVRGRFSGYGKAYWYLREDGLLIKCDERDSHTELHFSPGYNIPTAFSKSS